MESCNLTVYKATEPLSPIKIIIEARNIYAC